MNMHVSSEPPCKDRMHACGGVLSKAGGSHTEHGVLNVYKQQLGGCVQNRCATYMFWPVLPHCCKMLARNSQLHATVCVAIAYRHAFYKLAHRHFHSNLDLQTAEIFDASTLAGSSDIQLGSSEWQTVGCLRLSSGRL